MKGTKRIAIGLILALSLAVFLGTLAYAADPPTLGTITVHPAIGENSWGQYPVGTSSYDYHLYRIFDATIGFDAEGKPTDAISYTCTDAQKAIDGFDTYFTTSGTSVTGVTDAAKASDGGLSPAAVQWIKDHIDALGTKIEFLSSSSGNKPYYRYDYETQVGKFYNLPFGYYFLDSAVGSAVMINTFQPDAEIYNKNQTPTLEKEITKITESGGGEGEKTPIPGMGNWTASDSSLVQIGDTVEYTITVLAQPTAESYILADAMERSLTFLPNSVHVYAGKSEDNLQKISAGSDTYTIFTDDGPGFYWDNTDKQIKHIVNDEPISIYTDTNPYNNDDSISLPYSSYIDETGRHRVGAQFVIIFSQAFLDTITEPTYIAVTYEATVNEYALNVEGYNYEPEENAVVLNYGHSYSISDYAYVDTLRLLVYKYEGSGASSSSSSEGLNGVKFVLKREPDGKYFHQDPSTLVVSWVDLEQATKLETSTRTVYSYTGPVEMKGYITVHGLTAGTYTLIETDPLPGYNSAAPETFTMPTDNSYFWWQTQLNVVNKTGTLLPSTGGIGVTVYYVIGVSVLLGGAILLLKKKAVKES